MWTTVLAKLGLLVFRLLPIERIVAMLLNRVVEYLQQKRGVNAAKASATIAEYTSKAQRTLDHINEQVVLVADILRDQEVSAEEVGMLREEAAHLRTQILEMWAQGKPAKEAQKALAKKGVDAPYAEPLFLAEKRVGGARVGVMLAVAMVGLATLTGCLTRTRCQELTLNDCTVIVNEPQGIDGAGMPRSIQIGVQDQMVEGGTDSIASGNDTKPSLTIPMGDSTLGMIGQLLGGLFSKSATPESPAAPAPAPAAGCADGSCQAQ